MITVEQVDQIATGIRNALGEGKPKLINLGRMILASIIENLAQTDLEARQTAEQAGIGRLRSCLPPDTELAKAALDPCDSLHTEFLLIAPLHSLRQFAHKRTHHRTRVDTAVTEIPLDMVPPTLRNFIEHLGEQLRKRGEGGDDD
jgi:hypothetical protein